MNAATALAIVQTATAKAAQMSVRVVAVVVDTGGHPMALIRMEGTPFQCVDIAMDKARTAAGFGFPTSVWKDRLNERPHLLEGLTGHGGFIPIGGGEPILADGKVIGALGISGAKESEDEAIAAQSVFGA